ncbi:hypothetical protein AMECASPLE_019770 [Ameca splendens]|uniref:Uncharacterized protein n=1 Tax=Ameca splendens TaxID=208324 RepID=A0ABV0ZBX0_9TELE
MNAFILFCFFNASHHSSNSHPYYCILHVFLISCSLNSYTLKAAQRQGGCGGLGCWGVGARCGTSLTLLCSGFLTKDWAPLIQSWAIPALGPGQQTCLSLPDSGPAGSHLIDAATGTNGLQAPESCICNEFYLLNPLWNINEILTQV